MFDGSEGVTGQPYRAILFVNGWMMGKRVANLGCVAIVTLTWFLDLTLTSIT